MPRLTTFLLMLLLAAGPVTAGPMFLQEWLSRFLRDAVTEADRRIAQQAVERLNAGEYQSALKVAEQLRNRSVDPQLRTIPLGRLAETLGSADAESLDALRRLPPVQLGVFRDIEDVWRGVLWIRFVQDPVKEFNRRLERGFENFIIGLAAAPAAFKPEIDHWMTYRPEDRVAVVGAGLDDAAIQQFRREREAEGKVVFFYTDCLKVAGVECPHETIGAMMKTAGTTVLFESPNTKSSLFTLSEAGTVGRLRAGQTTLVLITPADMTHAGRLAVDTGAVIAVRHAVTN